VADWLDLRGFQFPTTDLSRQKLRPRVLFDESSWGAGSSLRGADIGARSSFDRATLGEGCSFDGATLAGQVIVDGEHSGGSFRGDHPVCTGLRRI
jgi:hypothetical protein